MSQKIEPHKITRPIQVLAASLIGMVLVVALLLAGASQVPEPPWAAGLLVVCAVLIVPLFLGFIFVLLTKHRPHLQEDRYFAAWMLRQEATFADFQPENLDNAAEPALADDVDDLEGWRVNRYEGNHGLFLVHSWRPSLRPGQVADVVIELAQHGEGPLGEGTVESVEYELGRKFFRGPVVKRNADYQFRLELSAYGPMLCLARVRFNDGTESLLLERYIDFERAL